MKKLFGKKIGVKSFFSLLVIGGVVLCLVLNVFLSLLDQKIGMEFDLSKTENFKLTNASVETAKSVDIPVVINVLATKEQFESNTNYNAQAISLIDQLTQTSSNITANYIDFVKNPSFTSQYSDLTLKMGDIIVQSDIRYTQIKTEDLFLYTQSSSGQTMIAGSQAESKLLSAIVNVSQATLPIIGVSTGHGEVDISVFTDILEDNGFQVEEYSTDTTINPEARVLIVASPLTDFSYGQIEILEEFLKNDGNYRKSIMFFDSSYNAKLDNISLFLEKYGIAQHDGAVFETDISRVYNSQPFYAVTDLLDSEYKTAMINSDRPMLMPVARPLSCIFQAKGNYITQVLAEFASSAGVKPSDAKDDFTSADSTMDGPFPSVIESIYTSQSGGQSRVIAISSIQSLAISSESYANTEFYIKLFSSLCEKETAQIILPITLGGSALEITAQTAQMILYALVIALPLSVLAVGVYVFFKRRNL